MATYSPNVSDKRPPSSVDDGEVINLRPLLNTFARWWLEILLITLIAVAVGSAYAYRQDSLTPTRYGADAQVALVRIVTRVNLEAGSGFQTTLNTPVGMDVMARRASLLGLVKSGTVARMVAEELATELNNESPTALLGRISAVFLGEGASDVIQISAIADTPEKATLIANAWARHYVTHINALYAELPAEFSEFIGQEVEKAQVEYETAQQAYETFLRENDMVSLTREVADKQRLIDALQATRQGNITQVISETLGYRQSVIDTYLKNVHQNRLLALTSEQEINQQLIQSLIQTVRDNRQLALATEQKARVQLFTQYADLELQNRLLALQQEQSAKSRIFQAYSDADIQAKLSVFNEQVNNKVSSLVTAYTAKTQLEELLVQATALQQQIEQAGEASALTNGLPLLMLKLEAYAVGTQEGGRLPGNLNLNLTNGTWETDIANQTQDLAVLIDTLTGRIAELDTQIEQESVALFNNEGYELLNGERPEDDPLYAAIQQQYLDLFNVGDLAQSASTMTTNTSLSDAIIAKYDELFGIGTLSSSSLTISNTTSIYETLQSQYPALFNLGDLSYLSEMLADDGALSPAGQEKLLELLQPDQELDNYLTLIDTGAEPLRVLEAQVSTLNAELEAKRAQETRLIAQRDVTLETLGALQRKSTELALERTAAGREVRLAAEANMPLTPIPTPNLILVVIAFGMGGFFVAVIIALLSSYMDAQPFLSRLRPAPLGTGTVSPNRR